MVLFSAADPYIFLHLSCGSQQKDCSSSVMKWGWEACTTPTSCFRTLPLTCLGLSTNFASCNFVVGLVRRILKWLLN